MIEPSRPSERMSVLNWCMRMWSYVRAIRPLAGPGLELKETSSGTIISIKARSGAGGGGSGPCPFGETTTTDDDPPLPAIRGGLIVCGDKNFAVLNESYSVAADGEWLVQIKLTGITCATDDDGEIFLPGVTTATGDPAWDLKEWTTGTDYDDNDNPSSPASPTGEIVLPIGRLKITDGVGKFTATGCGNYTIGQCAGILNYARS
jgi:hypothetical protein